MSVIHAEHIGSFVAQTLLDAIRRIALRRLRRSLDETQTQTRTGDGSGARSRHGETSTITTGACDVGSVSRSLQILRGKTAPGLIAEHARAKPRDIAYRAKKLGLYRERRLARLCRRGRPPCAGACSRSACRRAIASPSWATPARNGCCATWRAQAAGAIVYGIYPTASVSEVEFQMKDGGASIFIAEDQEYVDKILQVADRLPDLKWIVVIDDSAMFDYRHPKLKSLSEALARVAAGRRRLYRRARRR